MSKSVTTCMCIRLDNNTGIGLTDGQTDGRTDWPDWIGKTVSRSACWRALKTRNKEKKLWRHHAATSVAIIYRVAQIKIPQQ